jgi:hypothetical protein
VLTRASGAIPESRVSPSKGARGFFVSSIPPGGRTAPGPCWSGRLHPDRDSRWRHAGPRHGARLLHRFWGVDDSEKAFDGGPSPSGCREATVLGGEPKNCDSRQMEGEAAKVRNRAIELKNR